MLPVCVRAKFCGNTCSAIRFPPERTEMLCCVIPYRKTYQHIRQSTLTAATMARPTYFYYYRMIYAGKSLKGFM